MTGRAERAAGRPAGRRPGRGRAAGRRRRRRRPTGPPATSRRRSSWAGSCRLAGSGRGRGPRARAGTTGRAGEVALARAEDSPSAIRRSDLSALAVAAAVSGVAAAAGRLSRRQRCRAPGLLPYRATRLRSRRVTRRRRSRGTRVSEPSSGIPASTAASAAIAPASAWRFATSASSSRRSISRRTSSGGGASEPGGAVCSSLPRRTRR